MSNLNTRRPWLLPLFVLSGAALLRIGCLLVYRGGLPFADHPFGDAGLYLDWARQIASGVPNDGVFYRAPLYPYFLAVALKANASLWGVYAFQSLVGLGTVLLVYLTARRLFGNAAAVVSMVLAALAAPTVFFESKLLSATLVVFLVMLGTYLAVNSAERRRRWLWFLAGLSFGAAGVAWAGSLIIFVVLCAWAVLGKEAGRKALPSGILGCLMVVGVVTVRNAVVGQDLVPISANGGFTFYQGNNRLAVGTLAQPPEVFEFRHEGRYLTGIAQQDTFERLYAESKLGRSLKPSQVSGFWLGRALSWMVGHPAGYALLLGRKAALALSDYESPSDCNLDLELAQVWPLRLAFVRFGLLLALAVIGLWLAREKRAWPVYALALGTLVALLVFYVADRYRLPAFPALAVLAGAGVHELWRRARFRKLTPLPLVTGIVALLLSTVAFTLPLKRGSRLLLANGYRNLAQAYMYDTGNAAGAESACRRAINIYSASIDRASMQERLDLAETHLLLAKLYESTGRQSQADAEIEQARGLNAGLALPGTEPDPVSAARQALTSGDSTAAVGRLNRALAADSALREAYLLLGSILGAQKKHLQAQELFSRAVARFPGDPVLRYNLALAALNAGHYQTALDNAEAVLEQVPGHPWARKVADEARKKIRGLSP